MSRAIREEVFIREQQCPPEEEWDEYDAESRHFLGYLRQEPIATARWRVVEHEGTAAAKLERFAVLGVHRGRGYGRELVRQVMANAEAEGFDKLLIHAQVHLEDFYRSMGFETISGTFVEAGIPHVAMTYGSF